MDYSEVEVTILRKLYNGRIIGGRHTEVSSVLRGFRRSDAGDVRRCIEALVREGLILQSRKSGETHISLNHRRIGEIRAIIGV